MVQRENWLRSLPVRTSAPVVGPDRRSFACSKTRRQLVAFHPVKLPSAGEWSFKRASTSFIFPRTSHGIGALERAAREG